jgi:hypothetical protein
MSRRDRYRPNRRAARAYAQLWNVDRGGISGAGGAARFEWLRAEHNRRTIRALESMGPRGVLRLFADLATGEKC